jgi:hypothetical protein
MKASEKLIMKEYVCVWILELIGICVQQKVFERIREIMKTGVSILS